MEKNILNGNRIIINSYLCLMEKNILNGNRIIDGFIIPQVFREDEKVFHDLYISGTEYHKSFDWLIPVVKKFLSLDESICNYDVTLLTEMRRVKRPLSELKITAEISDIYNEVVTAISWYNERFPLQKVTA
jgi:hypothetical protein